MFKLNTLNILSIGNIPSFRKKKKKKSFAVVDLKVAFVGYNRKKCSQYMNK